MLFIVYPYWRTGWDPATWWHIFGYSAVVCSGPPQAFFDIRLGPASKVTIFTQRLSSLGLSCHGDLGCDKPRLLDLDNSFCFQGGIPGDSDGKASACNAGDLGLIPGSKRSPGEGNGNPLQYSCLENSMDRGAWWAIVHGAAKSGQDWVTSLFLFPTLHKLLIIFLQEINF